MLKILQILIGLFLVIMFFSFFEDDDEVIETVKDPATEIRLEKQRQYDDKYAVCYGQMTALYKKNGLHDRNRSLTIDLKEKACKSYAEGNISSYPGKK